MSDIEDLHKLAELKEKGLVTQEEFDEKKKEIFGKDVGKKQKGSNKVNRKGLWWKVPLLIVGFVAFVFPVLIAIILNLAGYSNNQNTKSESTAVINNNTGSNPKPSQVRVSPYERIRAMMPAGQSAMIDVVEAARRQYAIGANEMAKGASRPFRAQALCSILPNRIVSGWIGRVINLNTNGDGKGVLAVEIGQGISVKTWNNSLSDISDKTLIEPTSTLFGVATQLTKGQFVRFSGEFFKSETDCVRESSVSLSGSIEEPEFIFRFQSITPIDG